VCVAGKDKLLKRGVKEVVKAVRKNVVGVAVLAGNVDPMDVMSHLPVLFEDAGIPYVYVRSKESLGSAAQSKRSVSCVLVTAAAASAEYKDSYDKVLSECKTQLSSLC
jgi:H/ACA ribonucleoprotein complex subunit 2